LEEKFCILKDINKDNLLNKRSEIFGKCRHKNQFPVNKVVKGIRQYIFLLFHLEELLNLYVNLFYRFCATLLFLEIYEQKKSQISELSAILDFAGYACDIISRVTQEFYP
jgi:hypothetical protein